MLPRLSELTDMKKRFVEDMKKDRRMAEAEIMQGTWYTKRLWNLYKKELIEQSINWQVLMKAFGRCSWDFVEWVEGTKGWDETLSCFEDNIKKILKVA